jgi:hypothetical protein
MLPLAIAPADTAAVRTTLSVGVRVTPVAHLTMSAPQTVEITRSDIARGMVEVSAPTQLHVQSNSRAGFVLNVWPTSEFFAKAELAGPEGITLVGANGASVVNRWKTPDRHATLSITHRFYLASGLAPGVYAWPLKYEVQPL